MKTHGLGKLLEFLALASLFLAGCQSQAPGTVYPPAETIEAAETAVPAQPTETPAQATTSGEGGAPSPAGMQVPKNWLVLDEEGHGYSLAFPPEWVICQKTRYSRILCDIQEDPAWMGPPLRLYVSAFPNGYTNADWEVYNFIPTETIRAYASLPVGESMPKVNGSPKPEYVTYTRLPDRMVAGWAAPVVENSRLWGIPAGTKERVVFIVVESSTYIIGRYYETSEQMAMFQQVLDSFQITGQD